MPSLASRSRRVGLLVAMVGSTLAACSGDYNISAVRNLKTDGGTYQLALQQGYADVAQWKQEEQNWADSELMLGKARAAAGGAVPTMEEPTSDGLKVLRGRVDAALTPGRVERKPIDAAMLQVAYDCLARSSLNPPHPEGAKSHSCQTMFDEALSSLLTTPELTPPSEPTAIYFDRNQSKISEAGRAELKKIIEQIKAGNPREVIISGYSDSTGTLAANIVMAQKRVTAVYTMMVEAGIPADKIKQMVYGEEDPSLPGTPPPTPKGPKSGKETVSGKDRDVESTRRRVTISFSS